jgi:hypothetical protein
MSNRIPRKEHREDVVEFTHQRNVVYSQRLLDALKEHHGEVEETIPATPAPQTVLPPIPNAEIAAALELAYPRYIGRIEAIQRATLAFFPTLRMKDMKAQRRTAGPVRARQIAMYLAKDLTPCSLPEIGRHFGGRDHTTILHAYRKIGGEVQENPVLAQLISDIKDALPVGFE